MLVGVSIEFALGVHVEIDLGQEQVVSVLVRSKLVVRAFGKIGIGVEIAVRLG